MAWSGSGTFTRINTTVSPAVGDTTIDSSAQNTYTADVTAGINACLAKNGENSATGDINLGNNKLTNVANGSLATDAVNINQIQDSIGTYVDDTGAANSYVLTLSPAITSYVKGQSFTFKASASNTGPSVINVNSVGSKAILDQYSSALEGNSILANGVYTVVYDGTVFKLLSTTSKDVGFSVEGSNGAPITNTWTRVPWTTEVRDPGSNFASSGYTCPTDGVYLFNSAIAYGSMAADSGLIEIALYVNSSAYRIATSHGDVYEDTAGNSIAGINISVCDYFSIGDLIEIWTRHQGAATEALIATSSYNYFDGCRVNKG